MWNKSIKLVTGKKTETDTEGFACDIEEYIANIPANFKDLTRSDDLTANRLGYSADQNIEISACNYNGEKVLYDEGTGERYEIKRAYHPDKSECIILTCERR